MGSAQRALTARAFSTNSKYKWFQSCSATEGQRLFENPGVKKRQLERITVLGGDQGIVHLVRYRVLRQHLRNVAVWGRSRSEEHTSELQSHLNLVCRLLLEKQ